MLMAVVVGILLDNFGDRTDRGLPEGVVPARPRRRCAGPMGHQRHPVVALQGDVVMPAQHVEKCGVSAERRPVEPGVALTNAKSGRIIEGSAGSVPGGPS